MAAGLDSIAAIELSRNLGEQFSIELPSTILFDHPTTSSTAHLILAKLQSGSGGQVNYDAFSPDPSDQQRAIEHQYPVPLA